MRILIFHGYLLRGTGSNIYNNNLAQALAGLGHEVHLLCQDREAGEFDWVNAVGDWRIHRTAIGELSSKTCARPRGEGSVTVYRPDIGTLLPVYVEDPYEGFDARAYPRLTTRRSSTTSAPTWPPSRMWTADRRRRGGARQSPDHGSGDLRQGRNQALRGQEPWLGPRIHGQSPNPERFVPYAREGLEPAASVLVGSFHTAASLWEAVPMEGLKEKTGLGPPGVDTDDFEPLAPDERPAAIRELAADIAAMPPGAEFGRDQDAAVEALEEFAAADGPRVIFVGKLIVSKGVDLLVAAWPLIHAANPGARLLLAGFGAYELGLRALVTAIEDGDLESGRTHRRGGEGPRRRREFAARLPHRLPVEPSRRLRRDGDRLRRFGLLLRPARTRRSRSR